MPLRTYNGHLLRIGNDLASNEDCCCCSTGCECPTDTYLPSSVVATINVTDCCGIARTFTVTLAVNAGVCGCQGFDASNCVKYGYKDSAGRCPSACPNPVLSAWRCGDSCEDSDTLAVLNGISLQMDGCYLRSESGFGFCEKWAARFDITVKETNGAGTLKSGGSANSCGVCGWMLGCLFNTNCEGHSYWVCKSTLSRSPIGTYQACGEGAICNPVDNDDISSCLSGVTVTIS